MGQAWSVRAYEKGDENRIFRLTKAVWGEEVPEKERWIKGWRWVHIDNPAGISRIGIAEHNGKLVGQYPLILEDMKVGEEIIKGSQNIDIMTHPDYRHQRIAFTLEKKALAELAKESIQLIIGSPNQLAYPLHIKSGWFDVCAFQVMIKPLNLKNLLQKYFVRNRFLLNIFTVGGVLIIKAFFRPKKVLDEDMSKVREISSFDDRLDDFWNKISKDYNIIRIRDKRYLNWRYIDAPNVDYIIYVAEEEDEICGYVVLGCRNENSLTWGYIYDIIALAGRDDIIQCLIAKAVEYVSAKGVDAIFCKMIASKVYRRVFLKNGFIPHFRSKGRFIVYNTSTKLSEAVLRNSKNWFIQRGDILGVY